MFRLVSALVFLSACQLQSIDGNPALNIECTSGDNYCYRSDVCAYVLTYESIDNCSCTELERLVTAIDEVAVNVGLLGHRIDTTEDQIETLDQEQERNRFILHQVSETLTADEEAMRELERRVESLPNDTTISDALAPIEDSMEELELRLGIQQASLEERYVALIECQEDLTEVNRRVANQEQRLRNLNSEVQSQRRQIASLRSELTTKNARITSLQGQNEDLQRRSECYINSDASDYRGRVSRTRSGKTCQYWSSQYPHRHTYTRGKIPNGGLGNHNHCRNPDGEPATWCYTTDPNTRWEYCNVGQKLQSCGRECFVNADGSDYRGSKSYTRSRKTCQRWSSQSPHAHSYTPGNYPNGGLGYHNYCRNPDGEPDPWCYTTDANTRWEYCNIGVAGQYCG